MQDLHVTELTQEQANKSQNDLLSISLISSLAKAINCRVIISGGYAVDGALGQLTRPHNDIDIQIYGQSDDATKIVTELFEQAAKVKTQFESFQIEDKRRTDYNHNFYVHIGDTIADAYYLQTQNNPFEEQKVIIKNDGSMTEPHSFDTHHVVLSGINFEAQNPLVEVVDKIYKREHRGDTKKEKHEQDIYNLKLLVSESDIASKLGEIIK